MNDNFETQKDILVSLKHEISLLHQQVDYLLRNGKTLGLLDLDVMMNRTHTIYDQLCSINVGNNEEVEFNPEMLEALFGETTDEEERTDETSPEEDKENTEVTVEEKVEDPMVIREEPPVEAYEETVDETDDKEEDFGFIFRLEDHDEPEDEAKEPVEVTEEEPEEVMEEEPEEVMEEEPEEVMEEEPEVLTEEEPEEVMEEEPEGVMEEEPEEVTEEEPEEVMEEEPEEVKKNGVYTSGDQIEMEIPHLDLFDFTDEDEPNASEPETLDPQDEPFTPEDEPVEEKPIEENTVEDEPDTSDQEITYEPIIFGEMGDMDDGGFEIEGTETLGERMQHEEDHSLAARLQSQTVRDLRSAIGINDKFLFVNELFAGSMEKYTRSIENLDDLKTLNGALIYLNELRIELQWNSSNEAYKKLLELVHHKFE